MEHKNYGMSSTNDNRGTAKFMSVDESDEYEKAHEDVTERVTNSFNLNAELHNSTLIPKMVVGFEDEDQVRFTASPQTTKGSQRNSELADSAVETC